MIHHKLIQKTRGLIQLWQIFDGLSDLRRYRRLRDRPATLQGPQALRVRPLGGRTVYCRPGTSDCHVLIDTFFDRYHQAPVPLAPDAVILDLGANIGLTMADYAQQYPQARIIGVEMDPENAELARRNTASFGTRCQLLEGAVWDHDGSVDFEGDQAWAYSVVPASDPATAVASQRSTQSFTIESILSRFQINKVDFLKMDIEGAESVVLKPGAGWLDRVDCIALEFHGAATYESCRAILSAAGFRVVHHPQHPSSLIGIRQPAPSRPDPAREPA